MELDELLLTNRDAIGPAMLELVWIHHKLRQVPPEAISINRAAAALGKDKRTVGRNFRRLEEQGLIERDAVPGKAHRYRVCFSPQ